MACNHRTPGAVIYEGSVSARILSVMREQDTSTWTARRFAVETHASDKGTQVALRRMARDGLVERFGTGRPKYRITPAGSSKVFAKPMHDLEAIDDMRGSNYGDEPIVIRSTATWADLPRVEIFPGVFA